MKFADIFGLPPQEVRAGREETYEIRPETRHHSVASYARPLMRNKLEKFRSLDLQRAPPTRKLQGRSSVNLARPLHASLHRSMRKNDHAMQRSLLRRFTQNQDSRGTDAMRQATFFYKARREMDAEQRNVGAPVDHARSQLRKQADYSVLRMRAPQTDITERARPFYRERNAEGANRLRGNVTMKHTQRGGGVSMNALRTEKHFAPRQATFKGARPRCS